MATSKKQTVTQVKNQHQNSCLKLSKTHKSVGSLLTTATIASVNTNQSNAELYQNQVPNKLQDVNQVYQQPHSLQQLSKPQDGPKFNLMACDRPKKCNCKINETIITDLKKKLTSSENKLTDIRLEALSSVHQVDQLKDYLDKMRSEMASLKSENKMLKKYIQDKQTVNVNSPSDAIKELDEYYFNSGNSATSDHSKMNHVFQALNTNLNTYYYSYNFLLGDENESLLRKALITVECSYQLKLDNRTDSTSYNINNTSQISHSLQDSEFFAYEICTINVDSKLKWDLMDGIIGYVFKRYINKIDPNQSLGLTKNSISKYYIGEIVRKINDPAYPDMLPCGYLVGKTCTIRIVLKDNYQQLDSLSYETLIPRHLLEDYVNLLENHRLVGISSEHKFGKTFLMRKLGQFISKNNQKEIEMIYYNMEDIVNTTAYSENNNGLECPVNGVGNTPVDIKNQNMLEMKQKLLVNIEMKLRSLNNDKSAMILLDNYHVLFSSTRDLCSNIALEIVQSILRLIHRQRLYLVVTTEERGPLDLSANKNSIFDFNQFFKWINLTSNQSHFLHLYLNRNLIHYQVEQYKQKEACIIMEKVVAYVIEAFKVITDFMHSKLSYSENTSNNLIYFMGLPFNVEQSEKWFIELWNYSIIPQINDVIKMKLIKNDKQRMNLKRFDPTDWILNNYAWPKTDSSMNFHQRLLRIRFYTNDSMTFNRISSSSDDSSEFSPNNMSDNKNQNLISMLLRLKKAAYKEETSSGCFDSNSSNSSEVSPKSNSPTMSHSPPTNMNFKETSEFFNSLKIKNKIESAL